MRCGVRCAAARRLSLKEVCVGGVTGYSNGKNVKQVCVARTVNNSNRLEMCYSSLSWNKLIYDGTAELHSTSMMSSSVYGLS